MCEFEGNIYGSDVGRIIKKFDIYICDLGEINDDDKCKDLRKLRPCVIISSDNINNPKRNSYMIAPIRTEHKTEVNKNNADHIAKEKEKIGKLYIPIESAPGDFRFIDITETRKISSCDIIKYTYSILNKDLKKKINETLMRYLFSSDEIDDIVKDTIYNKEEQKHHHQSNKETDSVCTIINEEKDNNESSVNNSIKVVMDSGKNIGNVEIKKSEKKNIYKHKYVPITLPDNFKEIYDSWNSGVITTSEAIILLDIQANKSNKYKRFYNMVNKYEESIRAH